MDQTEANSRSAPRAPFKGIFSGVLRATAVAAALLVQTGAASAAYDLAYLKSLLDATPQGGWVKASSGLFSDAWLPHVPPGQVGPGLSADIHSTAASVAMAWSSIAWDSNRGDLLLWGGGHANYRGNEMYIWQGSGAGAGTWTRGSVPSRIEQIPTAADPRTYLVVDDKAPQSAHTYDGNVYLPVNDMFMTVGDAVYNTGAGFQVRDSSGNLVKAGPWMWDPRLADANKVGGSTGSGYDPSSLGGNMWLNRAPSATGLEGQPSGPWFENNALARRTENGHDVVYVTMQIHLGGNYKGAPDLYRYTVGDVRNGGVDQWEKVGETWNAPSTQGTATIDLRNNLFVHTTALTQFAAFPNELGVWDLSKAGPNNRDIGINLVLRNGSDFPISIDTAIEYDSADGTLWMWDGHDKGTVYRTKATYNADGTLASTWMVDTFTGFGDQPAGNFQSGVLGKFVYVSELGAYIALDNYNSTTKDSAVWLFKPVLSAPVPEPGTVWLWLAGLAAAAGLARRRRATA